MFEIKFSVVCIFLASFLVACGGGGDSTPANTLPTAQDVTINAQGKNSFTLNLNPYLFDDDGDTVRAALIRSEVIFGDIVIGTAEITNNMASITVTNGTGDANLYYQVSDGKATQPVVYRLVINNLDGV